MEYITLSQVHFILFAWETEKTGNRDVTRGVRGSRDTPPPQPPLQAMF